MLYTIEKSLFEKFPGFRRGVVVATGINNDVNSFPLQNLLSETASRISEVPSIIELERVDVWNEAYRTLGIDPQKTTPSIRFLLNQIRRGKPPRPINPVVDIFNITSLKWLIPCGGDDITSLNGGDLCLGFACGDETFTPLFKPTVIERPLVGEVIYYTPQTRQVLCRRWTWRNSDFSKLTSASKIVAINVDMMIPTFSEHDLMLASKETADLIKSFCGGDVEVHLLTPTNPSFRIES